MCGISGAVSNNALDPTYLVKMNQIIDHRGPDDEGFVFFNGNEFEVLGSNHTLYEAWLDNGIYQPKKTIEEALLKVQVFFGHRRLSIIDLSCKGHQPMCSGDTRFWITFNGEVYNFIEIRDELTQLGYVFTTNTDTEVILSAYQEWGIDCQNKFNGMWAFAIYDKAEKKLFLSRDRFGIKPLYYWFSPNGDFYFASEIKQFTVLPGWRAVVNFDRAYDYLKYALTDHTDETLFQGVFVLPPGCCFESNIHVIKTVKGKIEYLQWYRPDTISTKLSFEDAKTKFLEKFIDSIKLHLRADVPIGSALSGGLDSSSIVSYINVILKQQNKSELQKTFSSCSHDKQFDERNWMEEVVNDTRVEGHFVYPNGNDLFVLTDKLIWYMDEPYQSQSAFLGYHVFQEAKKFNVAVLLNGQGADEYLSGYNYYRLLRQKNLLKRFSIIQLIKELGSFSKVLEILFRLLLDLFPTALRYKISTLNSKNRAIDKIISFKKHIKKRIHPYETMDFDSSTHVSISKHQLFKDPLQKYLRWEDRNSMAHSVEARVPFLDHRLVEFVHSLPLGYLDAPKFSKRILVEAMKGILPEKVRNRRDKKGFITPEMRWFTKDFKDDFIKLFQDNVQFSKGLINQKEAESYLVKMQQGIIPFNYSYWHIILFCIWMKKFKVDIE
ncbi:MAG: asparagine synthase (glutamine-hydrolyzing) [Chitinophagia bacterium]|nr:asparagine synthase (glutamine-hydrolyzing) [Chitinophagia bacterium]